MSCKTKEIIHVCRGCSDDEIIEKFYEYYYDKNKPWVAEALKFMGIAENEVILWGYLNLK